MEPSLSLRGTSSRRLGTLSHPAAHCERLSASLPSLGWRLRHRRVHQWPCLHPMTLHPHTHSHTLASLIHQSRNWHRNQIGQIELSFQTGPVGARRRGVRDGLSAAVWAPREEAGRGGRRRRDTVHGEKRRKRTGTAQCEAPRPALPEAHGPSCLSRDLVKGRLSVLSENAVPSQTGSG